MSMPVGSLPPISTRDLALSLVHLGDPFKNFFESLLLLSGKKNIWKLMPSVMFSGSDLHP